MYIANPIYDVVFKYMMEDNKVAKLLISAIIGEKIEELTFSFQSHSYDLKADLTLMHFDFAAKITTPNGYKTVAIELQKAKLPSDIMRFRRYLGQQYRNSDNSSDTKQLKARQIYCIYFMNYDLGISDSPVLEVNHYVKDVTTGEEFSARNEFIESTQHRSWIIQIRHLKDRRRNELERLLSVFDQSYRREDGHVLDVPEEELPEQYRPLLRRLIQAGSTPEIRSKMDDEDTYIEDYLAQIRLLAERQKALEEKEQIITETKGELAETKGELAETKGELAETKGELAETKGELAETKGELAETKEALEEKDKNIEALQKRIAELEKNKNT
jgi:hypothetical protein